MINVEKTILKPTSINDNMIIEIRLTNMNDGTVMVLEKSERKYLGLSDYIAIGIYKQGKFYGKNSSINYFNVKSEDEKIYGIFKESFNNVKKGKYNLHIDTDKSIAKKYGHKTLTISNNFDEITFENSPKVMLTELNCIYIFASNIKTKKIFNAFDLLINQLSNEFELNNEKIKKKVYKRNI